MPERRAVLVRNPTNELILYWGKDGELEMPHLSDVWDNGLGGFVIAHDLMSDMTGYRFESFSSVTPIRGRMVDGLLVVDAIPALRFVRTPSMFPLLQEKIFLDHGVSIFTLQPRNIRREYIHVVFDVTGAADRLRQVESAARDVWEGHRSMILAGSASGKQVLNTLCFSIQHVAIESEHKMIALDKLLRYTERNELVTSAHLLHVVSEMLSTP